MSDGTWRRSPEPDTGNLVWALPIRAAVTRSELRNPLRRYDECRHCDGQVRTRLSPAMLTPPAFMATTLLVLSAPGRHLLASPESALGVLLAASHVVATAGVFAYSWSTAFGRPLRRELLAIEMLGLSGCTQVAGERGEPDRECSSLIGRVAQTLSSRGGQRDVPGLLAVILGDRVIGGLFLCIGALCGVLMVHPYMLASSKTGALWVTGVVAAAAGLFVRGLWIHEWVEKAARALLEARCVACGYPTLGEDRLRLICPECGAIQPCLASGVARTTAPTDPQ